MNTLEESEKVRKEREQIETKELEQKLVTLELEMAELLKKADAEKMELTKQLEAVTKSKDDEESAHKAAIEAMKCSECGKESKVIIQGLLIP